MSFQEQTNGRKKWGLVAAIAALAAVAVGITASVVVWAGEEPRGIQMTSSAIHFGNQDIGESSTSQVVTVTNRGGQHMIDSIAIDGQNAVDFEMTDASTCEVGPFERGDSCTIAVRFSPTAPGDRGAMLFVSGFSGGPGVSLWGTGRAS